jgi:hypothetical protein
MHVNGWPLALMVFAIAAGGYCLKLGKGARVISLCAALTAVLAVLAIPPWLDALASVFATGPGMVVLVILAISGGAAYITDHLKHHHPVRTTILGIIGATAGVMAWAMAPELGARGAQLGPRTAAALGQAQHQIASGHAASSVSGPTALVTLVAGAAIVFVIGRVIYHHHQRRPFPKAQKFGGGPAAALPAGTSGHGGGGAKKRGLIARLTGG